MTLPADYDPLDEQYRWCVFCGADCWPERENQRHAPDCPVRTGLYPLTAEDCPYGPVQCAGCDEAIEIGSLYALQDADTGELVVDGAGRTLYCICLGCAAGVAGKTGMGAHDG